MNERLYNVCVDYGYGDAHRIFDNLNAQEIVDWAVKENRLDPEYLEEETPEQAIELHLMDKDGLYYVEYAN